MSTHWKQKLSNNWLLTTIRAMHRRRTKPILCKNRCLQMVFPSIRYPRSFYRIDSRYLFLKSVCYSLIILQIHITRLTITFINISHLTITWIITVFSNSTARTVICKGANIQKMKAPSPYVRINIIRFHNPVKRTISLEHSYIWLSLRKRPM